MNPTPTAADSPPEQANRLLARTVNIGLDLGAPEELGWTIQVTDHHLDQCARAGFTAVRLATSLARHRDAADPRQLDPRTLEHLDQIIQAASERGLAVVIANMHDPDLMADPPRHRGRLLACTRQLAAATQHHGPSLILEPLAEPRGALDPVWNDYLRDLCAAVRDVDPDRTLMAGPRSYNNARFLAELSLPAGERNLILTLHHYWPIRFTMQGEVWLGPTELGDPATWLGTTWDGTPQQRTELETGFEAVAVYARTQQLPVFIGEFGTTNNADMPARVRWTQFNRQLAEHHGFAWGCWSYAPTFAIYDTGHDRWHQALLDALIPSSRLPDGVTLAP